MLEERFLQKTAAKLVKEQMKDPCICLFLSKKEAGVGCPLWQEVTAMFLPRCIGLIGILSKLRAVLYKKWEAPNLKKTIFQLIVPRKLIAQILEELIFLQVGTLASIKRLKKYGAILLGDM